MEQTPPPTAEKQTPVDWMAEHLAAATPPGPLDLVTTAIAQDGKNGKTDHPEAETPERESSPKHEV